MEFWSWEEPKSEGQRDSLVGPIVGRMVEGVSILRIPPSIPSTPAFPALDATLCPVSQVLPAVPALRQETVRRVSSQHGHLLCAQGRALCAAIEAARCTVHRAGLSHCYPQGWCRSGTRPDPPGWLPPCVQTPIVEVRMGIVLESRRCLRCQRRNPID